MKWLVPVIVLLMAPVMAAAQRTPPDALKICFSQGDCISMMMIGDYYIGWTGPRMDTEWRLTVDHWTMDKLQLSGRATFHADIYQKSDFWVIKGTPDAIRDGVARGKAKDVGGHDARAGKVTVTWEPNRPKVYGRVVR